MARHLPASIHQLTPTAYRNPAELPDGDVLVVGASASGVQLAEEIQRSGRQVTISVSRHTRLPRLYRGRDIMWWLDQFGILEDDADHGSRAGEPRGRCRRCSSLADRSGTTWISRVLRDIGVRLVGRVAGVRAGVLRLNDNLAEAVAGSHARLERLLRRIDVFADAVGAPAEAWPAPFAVDASPVNARPGCQRDHDRHLGDRFQAQLFLVARAGARCVRRDHPHRRRHAVILACT